MAGRALARGALDAISEKFSRRCTSSLDRDIPLSQEPLSQGLLGEAVRARPADGQVIGSMARESVLFIGTQFSILYTFVYSPA